MNDFNESCFGHISLSKHVRRLSESKFSSTDKNNTTTNDDNDDDDDDEYCEKGGKYEEMGGGRANTLRGANILKEIQRRDHDHTRIFFTLLL